MSDCTSTNPLSSPTSPYEDIELFKGFANVFHASTVAESIPPSWVPNFVPTVSSVSRLDPFLKQKQDSKIHTMSRSGSINAKSNSSCPRVKTTAQTSEMSLTTTRATQSRAKRPLEQVRSSLTNSTGRSSKQTIKIGAEFNRRLSSIAEASEFFSRKAARRNPLPVEQIAEDVQILKGTEGNQTDSKYQYAASRIDLCRSGLSGPLPIDQIRMLDLSEKFGVDMSAVQHSHSMESISGVDVRTFNDADDLSRLTNLFEAVSGHYRDPCHSNEDGGESIQICVDDKFSKCERPGKNCRAGRTDNDMETPKAQPLNSSMVTNDGDNANAEDADQLCARKSDMHSQSLPIQFTHGICKKSSERNPEEDYIAASALSYYVSRDNEEAGICSIHSHPSESLLSPVKLLSSRIVTDTPFLGPESAFPIKDDYNNMNILNELLQAIRPAYDVDIVSRRFRMDRQECWSEGDKRNPMKRYDSLESAMSINKEARVITLIEEPYMVVHVNAEFTRLAGFRSCYQGRPLREFLEDDDSTASFFALLPSLTCLQTYSISVRSLVAWQGWVQCKTSVALVGPSSQPATHILLELHAHPATSYRPNSEVVTVLG